VRLRATRWSGVGTPVLLLHGLASQRRFWNLVVPLLSGLPVLALDQRGHGESDKPSSGYDTATVVRDVSTALDALGWRRVAVIGHSWGAIVALGLAAAEPERVTAVACIDGGFGGLSRTASRAELREMLTPPRIALPPDELRQLLRDGMAWWTPEVEAALLPGFDVGPDGLMRSRLAFEHHMQVVDAILDADPAADFDRIRAPAWLVSAEPIVTMTPAGAADPAHGDWLKSKNAGLAAAAERLAQPRLLRWAGAVHDVPLQWPALVAGLVRTVADEGGKGGLG
jgi:pimeloyl-ACP methyl ester carboxylesterase